MIIFVFLSMEKEKAPAFKLFDINFTLENNLQFVFLISIILFFLLSISLHIYKAHILVILLKYDSNKEIDKELNIYSILSSRPSFIYADNAISDFFFSGTDALPSLRRIIFLQFTMTVFGIFLLLLAFYKINCLIWFIGIIVSGLFFVVQILVFFSYYYKRISKVGPLLLINKIEIALNLYKDRVSRADSLNGQRTSTNFLIKLNKVPLVKIFDNNRKSVILGFAEKKLLQNHIAEFIKELNSDVAQSEMGFVESIREEAKKARNDLVTRLDQLGTKIAYRSSIYAFYSFLGFEVQEVDYPRSVFFKTLFSHLWNGEYMIKE